MARFSYKAIDGKGGEQRGEVEAKSLADALDLLDRQGLHPFDTRPAEAAGTIPWWQRDLFSGPRLPQRAMAQLMHELATLLAADLPLDECLRLALLNQPPSRTRAVLTRVLDGVLGGSALSRALADTRAFPAYVVDMLKAGEQAGALASVMAEVARHLERAGAVRERILSALVYPAVLIVLAIVALTTILVLLVPSLAGVFADSGVAPPATVQVLLAIRTFLADYPIEIASAAAALVLAIVMLLRLPQVRLMLSRALLAMPLAGQLVREAETARLARVMAVQLTNGVPMVPAIATATGLVGSRFMRDRLGGASDRVAQGAGLTRPLEEADVLPALLVRLVKVGEETGQVERMLLHAAQIYEGKVERRIDRLIGLLTPALTILIGAAIGSIVLGVMNAVLSINDTVLR